MTRPHQRALAWLVRHPTVLVIAAVITAVVAVVVIGDLIVIPDSVTMSDFNVEPMDGGGSYEGPNSVEDG
jgi:hypothetical protein